LELTNVFGWWILDIEFYRQFIPYHWSARTYTGFL